MGTISESIKANKQSAKDNGWGVLPGGPYAGINDPTLLGDIAAVNAVAFGEVGAGDVVSKDLVERLKKPEDLKLIRDAAKGNPAAERFLDNIDLNPKATKAINLGLGGTALAGAAADRFLVPRPTQLVR